MDKIEEIKLEPAWDDESQSLCSEQPSSVVTHFAFVKCEEMCKDEPEEETEEEDNSALRGDDDSKEDKGSPLNENPETRRATAPTVDDGIKKSQPCPHCNKRFKKRSYLEKHIQLVHAESERLHCTKCEASFTTMSNLTRHHKIHNGQKAFSCGTCSRLFTRKETLQKHIFSHDGVKPFLCSLCCSTFTRKTTLLQHQAVHTGSRPYECTVCRKCFRWKADLQKHRLKHT